MQQGGKSPLVAIAGPDCTPELGELFLTGERDLLLVAAKFSPSQNMTSI